MHRVAVTGMGVLCASGASVPEFWENLTAGRSAIAPIELVDRGLLRSPNGAEVRGYNPLAHFDPRQADLLDRFAQFALIAARQAVADAGLERVPAEAAIFTGACVGGQSSEDEQFRRMYGEQATRVHPLTIPRVMANAAASAIAEEFHVHGPALTVSTACSSSAHALGLALQMVRSGAVPVALAGGSEAVFSLGFLRSWEAMRVLSPDTCRPFSLQRKGLVLGEGAAMLVLEPMEAARARGATVYAEFAGAGMSADGHHITQPSAEGAALAMRRALNDAGLAREEIDYINAHGTGTLANDATECAAIELVFAARARRLAISSTKSMHGHTLGAAGALEAIATVLTLRHALAPPTANFTEPDPACGLDVIPNTARVLASAAALSNSFAFGGLNAVLAFRAAE
jgi:nodulation protein E